LVATRAELATARVELAATRTRMVELEAQLGRNSQNSSQPPSSDPPWTPRPLRKSRGRRKRGGQHGHKGAFATEPEHIDQVHPHRAKACQSCAAELTDGELTGACVRHYVYELPEIRPVVHEHRRLYVKCPKCGQVTLASLPAGVPTGHYDASVQAMTGLLRGEMRQSVRQASEVMTKVLHVPMSPGMVAKTQEHLSCALQAPFEQAHQYAKAQDRAHADETSWRQDKKKAWLWVCVTGLVIVFVVHVSRGAQAAKALLGEAFGGLLMTDRWASYRWVQTTRRQLCWSHLKRDFKSFLDYGPDPKRLGERLLCQTRRMFRLWHRVRDGTLSRTEFQLLMKPVRRQVEALLQEGRSLSCAKVSGMCKQILGLREALFTFVEEERLEPTNNAAERALRFAVLWRKGSFGSDSARGSRFVERFLTVRATLRSQKRDLSTFLKAACAARIQGAPAPSLLPDLAQNTPILRAAA
jgi:transposase